jgi:hypothetical protein
MKRTKKGVVDIFTQYCLVLLREGMVVQGKSCNWRKYNLAIFKIAISISVNNI